MSTRLLDKALAEIEKLPESEQESLAAWILEEIASERRWTEAFARSEDLLSRLADEALDEHSKGETAPLNPDKLCDL